jgi:PAN domain
MHHPLQTIIAVLIATLPLINSPKLRAETAPANSPSHITRQKDCDIAGAAISSKPSPNAEQCEQLCQQTTACLSYVFISGWNRCFLKDIKKITPLTIAAGKKNDDGTMTHWDHHDIGGRDLLSLKAKNIGECEKKCSEDTRCVGFAFLDGYQTCWIKDKLKSGKPYPKVFFCGTKNTTESNSRP